MLVNCQHRKEASPDLCLFCHGPLMRNGSGASVKQFKLEKRRHDPLYKNTGILRRGKVRQEIRKPRPQKKVTQLIPLTEERVNRLLALGRFAEENRELGRQLDAREAYLRLEWEAKHAKK